MNQSFDDVTRFFTAYDTVCAAMGVDVPPPPDVTQSPDTRTRLSNITPESVLRHYGRGEISDEALRMYRWWVPICRVPPYDARQWHAQIDYLTELNKQHPGILQFDVLLRAKNRESLQSALVGVHRNPVRETVTLTNMQADCIRWSRPDTEDACC